MLVILAAALIFGVTMTLPIGGADMPVVISLLNSFTGTAVAMAGFVIDNPVLIIAGALVGASGAILTKLMADAMNRSVLNIMIGGFGGGDGTAGAAAGPGGSVRSIGADDVAIQLAYAQHVIIVPGLRPRRRPGPARRARAGRAARGARRRREVRHPSGGRPDAGAHERAARRGERPLSPAQGDGRHQPGVRRAPTWRSSSAPTTSRTRPRAGPARRCPGMPILDVDQAKSIVVIKRSMGRGYAGIDNELYTNEKTGMLFADAKDGLAVADRGGQGALARASRRSGGRPRRAVRGPRRGVASSRISSGASVPSDSATTTASSPTSSTEVGRRVHVGRARRG